MPTGEEYRTAEGYFRDLAGRIREQKDAVNNDWPGAVERGPLEQLIERTVRATLENIESSAGLLEDLSGECKRRSQVCDGYDAAVMEHNRKMDVWRAKPDRNFYNKPYLADPSDPWVTPTVQKMES